VSGERVRAPHAELLGRLVELSAQDWRAFRELEAIFSALRDPDIGVCAGSAYYLGVALSGRLRAALRGTAGEYEEWVRGERVLERALALLFKEFSEANFKWRAYSLRQYLDKVASAFKALSRLAAFADRLAVFAYALDTGSYVEALNAAVERGLVRPAALHAELLRLGDERLVKLFYEEWRKGRMLVLWGWQVELPQAAAGRGGGRALHLD